MIWRCSLTVLTSRQRVWVVVAAAMVGHPVAHRTTGHRTGHGGRLAAIALADGAAQHAAHHRAKDGAGRAVARIPLHHLLVVALLARHGRLGDAVDRVDPQHVGPAVVGVVVLRRRPRRRAGVTRVLRLGASGDGQGQHQRDKEKLGHFANSTGCFGRNFGA